MTFQPAYFIPEPAALIARVNVAAALQLPVDLIPAELRPIIEDQIKAGHVVLRRVDGVNRLCSA